jgi:hypothetical protein
MQRGYMLCNLDAMITVPYLNVVNKAASQLGIKFVFHKVHSAAIEALPKENDAIYRIPSITIGQEINEMSEAETSRVNLEQHAPAACFLYPPESQ